VDRTIEAKVDHERLEVTRQGRVCQVRPFPIGIDAARHAALARAERTEQEIERWRRELDLGDRVLGIGIDRLDYTKGIPERLRALDTFLTRNPQWVGRLQFVQVGVPSRSRIPAYRDLAEQVEALVEEINWKWGGDSWQPIVYFHRSFSREQLIALHRLARFCVISSLHDGMNLVAKEYVASRVDEDGVLVLSRFTGAARELTDAILVNPFSEEEMVEGVRRALEMPLEERRQRMTRLREVVATRTVYRWAGKFVSTLLQIRVPDGLEERKEEPA
jgi:trehalose 6-phosphate synthase